MYANCDPALYWIYITLLEFKAHELHFALDNSSPRPDLSLEVPQGPHIVPRHTVGDRGARGPSAMPPLLLDSELIGVKPGLLGVEHRPVRSG